MAFSAARLTLTAALFCLSASLGLARELPVPAGPVVLTISGAIEAHNGPDGACLDIDMLEAVGKTVVETGTIWTDGKKSFDGVSLAALMDQVGAKGKTLRLTALNDYAIDLPYSEVVEGGPFLAYRMDGVDLSPRDKGPVWLLYPFDSKPEYQNEVSYSRSIWQLTRIEVLP